MRIDGRIGDSISNEFLDHVSLSYTKDKIGLLLEHENLYQSSSLVFRVQKLYPAYLSCVQSMFIYCIDSSLKFQIVSVFGHFFYMLLGISCIGLAGYFIESA